MDFNSDIIEPDVAFKIEEKNGDVDGQSILAKVSGTFFVPNGVSRNRRFYPKSLWEKVLSKPDVKERLQNKRMFGTIGHDQIINDNAILEGKVSHIVTDLKIDDKGQGIGEALILDTPAGKALNTLLRAGSKLFVSSRATGKYKGEHKGLPMVDENTYALNTFDFVIDPGFLQANPSLRESLDKILTEIDQTNIKPNSTGVTEMDDKKLAQHIIDENAKLKSDLDTALDEYKTTQSELAVANNEVTNLKEENEELQGVKEELDKYKEFGSVEEVKALKEDKEKLETELKEYKDIDPDATPDEIAEAIDNAQALIDEYKSLGSPEKIREAVEKLQKFKEDVEEYGSLEDVIELYNFAKDAIDKEKKVAEEKAIKELADELGVSEERIAKVYTKLSVDEIKELFKDMKKETKVNELKNRYTQEFNENDSEDEVDEDDEDERPSYSSIPLCERVMNNLK